MRVRFKNTSLYRNYLLIAVSLITVMSVVLLLSTYFAFQNQSEEISQNLKLQAERLKKAFADQIDFTEYEMLYMARQIKTHGFDLNYTGELLKTFRTRANDILPWSAFLWADKSHHVLATNNFGIIDPLKDLSERDYIPKTKAHPYQIFLGKPVYGIVSRQWVIPAGVGVTDSKSKFLGSVVTGINIPKLAQKLDVMLTNEQISFAIFDEDQKIVLKSQSFSQFTKENGVADLLATPHLFKGREGALLSQSQDLLGTNGYAYYRKLDTHPYTALVTYDKSASDKEISGFIYVRLIEMSVLIFIVAATLCFLHKWVVLPLSKLSKVADRMSHGCLDTKIPRGGPLEVHLLAKQLLNLQRYIRRIQRTDYKLVRAKNEAEKANQAKSDFLAHMSHELRTPLNAVIGYSEIMLSETLGKLGNKKYREYIQDIHGSGQHLLCLINDILDLSKAEANRFTLNETTVDMVEMLHSALSMVSNQAQEKQQKIVLDIQEGLPGIRADALRIRQILLNLISNAIKFSSKGKEIHVGLAISKDQFAIAVKDHGIGIPQKDISRILEKFCQLHTPLARQSDGTGLGLWVVQMLVDAHQGTLHIDSEVGEGTTVTVILPHERIVI